MSNRMKNPVAPGWIATLRALMEARGQNPRSLSVLAGLNPTAVRDMLEGRTRFPRYDTVQALAKALETTPAALMGEEGGAAASSGRGLSSSHGAAPFDDDLELLTRIIAELQKAAAEHRHAIAPQDFAAMVTSLYRQTKGQAPKKRGGAAGLRTKIRDLLDYERMRRRRGV